MRGSLLHDAHAVLFDLDGVLTPTADLHRRCWQEAFNSVSGAEHLSDAEYLANIDGRPREEGVRLHLQMRGVIGTTDPAEEIVSSVAQLKDDLFKGRLAEGTLQPYPGSIAFLGAVLDHGCQVAVVSSSRNARAVLAAAGLSGHFEVVVDGVVAEREGLRGKPQPDMFSYAASELSLPPTRCAAVEDASAGAEAAYAAGCRPVIGVDRGGNATALRHAGCEPVVTDLSELVGLGS